MTREEHIENLKAIASDMPSDKCADWIESLMAGINAMEELKAYREAWNKMQEEIDKLNPDDNSYSVKNNACLIVSKYRPKEGDNNDSSNN